MTALLSDRLQSTARALEASDLTTLSGVLDAEAMIDALEHAAVLAVEAEADADRAGNVTDRDVRPAYPPLVRLLGIAVERAA